MTHPLDDAVRDLIASTDPDAAAILDRERARQEHTIELIASENHASPAVMHAAGTCFTNKYAEGYPGRRYYGGCAHMDEVETLARERAKALFNCEYANVQPHSGAQANMAVFMALLEPGDTFASLLLQDEPEATVSFDTIRFGVNVDPLPDSGWGWRRGREGVWAVVVSADPSLPRQRLVLRRGRRGGRCGAGSAERALRALPRLPPLHGPPQHAAGHCADPPRG